jgi:hypothetical protein
MGHQALLASAGVQAWSATDGLLDTYVNAMAREFSRMPVSELATARLAGLAPSAIAASGRGWAKCPEPR